MVAFESDEIADGFFDRSTGTAPRERSSAAEIAEDILEIQRVQRGEVLRLVDEALQRQEHLFRNVLAADPKTSLDVGLSWAGDAALAVSTATPATAAAAVSARKSAVSAAERAKRAALQLNGVVVELHENRTSEFSKAALICRSDSKLSSRSSREASSSDVPPTPPPEMDLKNSIRGVRTPSMIDAARKTKAQTIVSAFQDRKSRMSIGIELPTWRDHLRERISRREFDFAVFFLIFTNVLVVGVETDIMASSNEEPPMVLEFINWFYTVCFAAELGIRLVAHGRRFFTNSEWGWNVFDTLVVSSSVLEMVLDILAAVFTNMGDLQHMRLFRVIRVVRLTRILRMIRLFKFVRALRTMVMSIMFTLKSLVWALLLLVMVFYGFAIAFTQAVSEWRWGEEPDSPEQYGTLVMFWGTVPRSMFTLLKAVTGGISWHETVHPLASVSEITVVLFLLYLVFVIFAVMNVITGAFCQSAIESAQSDKDFAAAELLVHKSRVVEELAALFGDIDLDGSGVIDLEEFQSKLEDEAFLAYFSLLEIDVGDVWTLFKLLDADSKGFVSLHDFVHGCLHLRGHAKTIHIAKLQHDQELFRFQMNDMLEEVTHLASALIEWSGADVIPRCRQSRDNRFSLFAGVG